MSVLQIVTKEQAVRLSLLGFDGRSEQVWMSNPTIGLDKIVASGDTFYVADGCATYKLPTVALALKWLREKHNFWIEVYPDWNAEEDLKQVTGQWGFEMRDMTNDEMRGADKIWHDDYDKAESAGLDCVLHYLSAQKPVSCSI